MSEKPYVALGSQPLEAPIRDFTQIDFLPQINPLYVEGRFRCLQPAQMHAVGRAMDEGDRGCFGHSLELAKNGRTVHSLARLLSLFKVKINYISPDILRMPKEVMDEVAAKGITQAEYSTLDKVLPETDVLYVTRVQRERFEDPADYEKVKGAYVIDPAVMKAAKREMIVMHPLPRVGEISMEVDHDPRAAYFRLPLPLRLLARLELPRALWARAAPPLW